MRAIFLTFACAAAVLPATRADAFCGFYVGGAGAKMFNNATEVVLMRHGTTTVLSMQNNYQGPPDKFALVVPVPVVVKEKQVRTLPPEVFAKVDVLGAPRLVEYWEHDPCGADDTFELNGIAMAGSVATVEDEASDGDEKEYKVKIEAKFSVGEYDIVVLSAQESTGLDRWLRANKYEIPAGAEPLLRPYIEQGSKFFVAKVDPKKVRFTNGMATLSPLRFSYDSPELVLPIRLGLANSNGAQDLIVNILAPNTRYEVANHPNVTIPTNLAVRDEVRTRFGEFYAALFDRTVQQNPGAIVTEYAWDAGTCDPCPGPNLDGNDFATLGADVLGDGGQGYYNFVLTRLHARYGKEGAPNDLVFRAAPPIVGGREIRGGNGQLEQRAQPADQNNFQGRYAIRHAWTGAVACANPQRGRWGGPPAGTDQQIAGPQAATNVAFAPRGKVSLPSLVAQDVPEIAVEQGKPMPGGAGFSSKARGCGCQSSDSGGLVMGLLGLGWLVRRRRPVARRPR